MIRGNGKQYRAPGWLLAIAAVATLCLSISPVSGQSAEKTRALQALATEREMLTSELQQYQATLEVLHPDGTPPELAPPTVRQISIPTTLSGGEFSSISGITNEGRQSKEMLRHPLVMPQAVILDPAE